MGFGGSLCVHSLGRSQPKKARVVHSSDVENTRGVAEITKAAAPEDF